MRTSLTASALGLLAIATLALGGCGLKGDLYLPGSESEPPSPAAESESNRDDDDENADQSA